MVSSDFQIWRRVSESEQFKVAQLQASIARLIGTHIGNSYEPRRAYWAKAVVLPASVVEDATEKSTALQTIEDAHLKTLLLDVLGPLAFKDIPVNTDGLWVRGTGTQKLVSLRLASKQLADERQALGETLGEVANTNIHLGDTFQIDVARITDAAEIDLLMNAPSLATPGTIALDGIKAWSHRLDETFNPRQRHQTSYYQPGSYFSNIA